MEYANNALQLWKGTMFPEAVARKLLALNS